MLNTNATTISLDMISGTLDDQSNQDTPSATVTTVPTAADTNHIEQATNLIHSPVSTVECHGFKYVIPLLLGTETKEAGGL
jgi:hypothetical protein